MANMYYPTAALIDFWRPINPYNMSRPTYLRVHENPRSSSSSSSRTTCPVYTYKIREGVAYFEIEIPGVEKDDISVQTRGKKLDIVAKRYKHDSKAEDKKKLHIQYRFVAHLSDEANLAAIKADYRGLGILRLYVPLKNEEVRKIHVEC